jgi:hypothetical protein
MKATPSRPLEQPDSSGDAGDEQQDSGSRSFLLFQAMPSWLTSFLIHLVLIIILAVFTFDIPEKILVSLVSGEVVEELADLDDVRFDSMETSSDLETTSEAEVPEEMEVTSMVEEFTDVTDTSTEPAEEYTETATSETTTTDAPATSSAGLLSATASMLGARSGDQRARAVAQNGGTPGSENAVNLALKWIAKHQLTNGSWSFDHRTGPGTHRTSPDPGDFENSPNAATAMAILTFLGAGHTHTVGDYTENVEKGLAFLIENADRNRNGWSWYEDMGGLYNHALVSIALCEAYAMTNDARLRDAAEQSIRFIEVAQDNIGGGWRYSPRMRGDLSVTGFMVMALKSANMCGIEMDDEVIRKARRFLNYMSAESGAFYGYFDPPNDDDDRRKGMTSVGLLCQMYLGWTKDNPALGTGVKWLSDRGPETGEWDLGDAVAESSKTRFRAGMYYNYYATQVLSQYGGDHWKKWNDKMREFLIATQATEGAAAGSWYFDDPDETGYIHGGRLYATTLAAMTLEVYYRYLPLYDEKKTGKDEFILD